MSSEVFEEPLELEIEILEAGPPTRSSYPYPSLTQTGTAAKRAFRSVIVENPYLRTVVVPTLGGRILSLFDKRTGTEILPPPKIVSGGVRGVRMIGGIELHLDERERRTALAAVQSAAHETEDDEPAILWLAEAVTGTGLSWHLRISLPPDRAELQLEARVFNRGRSEIAYNSGLLLPAGPATGSAEFVIRYGEGRGIGLTADSLPHAAQGDGWFRACRFEAPQVLAPHQTDTWQASILPISDLPTVAAVGTAGALGIGQDGIRIQATAPLEGHKVVILTGEGKTLEAPLQATPEHTVQYDLPNAPSAIALLDPAKRPVLKWEGAEPAIVEGPPSPLSPSTPRALNDRRVARFDVRTRHLARFCDAQEQLAAGDYDRAEYSLEQSLLYDGEDHLAWWLKAVAARLSGAEGESAELLNAHYLAPLEPALRAESFLAQPRRMEKDPSALLAPMDEHPESFIEVACLLIESGLIEQAGYWIDEALRHVDLPLLRYLLAFAHLESTKLEYEAANLVAEAGKSPVAPPYPWRELEWTALERLAQRFPDDPRLQAYLSLRYSAE